MNSLIWNGGLTWKACLEKAKFGISNSNDTSKNQIEVEYDWFPFIIGEKIKFNYQITLLFDNENKIQLKILSIG